VAGWAFLWIAGLSAGADWWTAPLYAHRLAVDDNTNTIAAARVRALLPRLEPALNRCMDGLTEEQAHRSLVPSRTTLLGLVKHATFVEKVWFDEAVTCRSRAEIGMGRLFAARTKLDAASTAPTVGVQPLLVKIG
jgi:hypothetical protein